MPRNEGVRVHKTLRDNGLSIVFGLLFLGFLLGQTVAGHAEYNNDREEHNRPALTYRQYLFSSHSLEATTENWESEFLQMAMYVLLTAFLFQRGSAESKDPDEEAESDRDPRFVAYREEMPGPVKRGGWMLKLYENSLGLALLTLFFVSFLMHAWSGSLHYSEQQLNHGQQAVGMLQYMTTSQFWFESFQNWQSEFLAVLAMVVLSIFLRQKGSPESKPVHAGHSETGNS
jgi:hypothetical protein